MERIWYISPVAASPALPPEAETFCVGLTEALDRAGISFHLADPGILPEKRMADAIREHTDSFLELRFENGRTFPQYRIMAVQNFPLSPEHSEEVKQ